MRAHAANQFGAMKGYYLGSMAPMPATMAPIMAPNHRALNYTLTPTKVHAAKPKAKAYPLADAGGLYLDILPSGSKVWRYSYRIDGKRTKVTIGPYPSIGIKAARDAHESLRGKLLDVINPAR